MTRSAAARRPLTNRGGALGRRRPLYVRVLLYVRVPRALGAAWRTNRGAHGHGQSRWERYADRPVWLLGLWPAISGCLPAVAVFLVTGLSVLKAEGVGDALVGGVGLPVDAVGVDLEQDGDAVPGTAGDVGGGHPGVEPEGYGGVTQVEGAATQRRPALGGGQRALVRASAQTAP